MNEKYSELRIKTAVNVIKYAHRRKNNNLKIRVKSLKMNK